MALSDIFKATRPVVGMLHAPALPGSPQNTLGLSAILDWVLRDADALREGGVDGLLLENFGDAPFFPRRSPPHVIAFMTALAWEVQRTSTLPLGINVLRNDSEGALAVASAAGAAFVRVNVHTGARLTDQGVIEGIAHRTLRYRKFLGSDVRIFADVDVKHSAALAPRPLEDEVEETISRGCADAIIITGSATGKETRLTDINRAKAVAAGTPVIAGSGVDSDNVAGVLKVADGVIVGTAFKRDGQIGRPVDAERVRRFMQVLKL